MTRYAIAALLVAAPLVASATEKPPAITLAQALERLDSQNLNLAQTRARAQEAHTLVRQAAAAFLPIASASGSYTRNNAAAELSVTSIFEGLGQQLGQVLGHPVQISTAGLPANTIIQPLEAFTGAAGVRVPLFAGNAYWDWSSTRESAKAADESVKTARLQLRAALEQAAWWSGATEEIADATERALTIAAEHELSAKRAVEVGNSAPLAQLQAQTEVVRRESDLVRAVADRERAWLAVGVLLGKPEPLRIELPAAPAALSQGDSEALTREALSRRPELRAQELAIRAAELQVDSAWWRIAPQLSASFSGVLSSVALPTGDKGAWKATVDLSWTLYDGGFRYGKKAQAEAQIASGRAGLEEQRVEISQQVKDALRDLTVAREQVQLAERQRQLALEVQASATRSFNAGIASSLDVLDANDRLYEADVGMASAKARLGMAQAALDRATGALL